MQHLAKKEHHDQPGLCQAADNIDALQVMCGSKVPRAKHSGVSKMKMSQQDEDESASGREPHAHAGASCIDQLSLRRELWLTKLA